MSPGEKPGLAAAVQAVDAAGGMRLPLASAEQLALLDDGETSPTALRRRIDEAKRRGRPPGAANKRTREMASYLLSQYQSPLIALAEIYSRPIDELQAEIPGATKLELLKLQVHAAAELAPYVHGKMPVEVSIGLRADGVLVIPGFNVPAGTVDQVAEQLGSITIEGETVDVTSFLRIDENQGVSET